MQFYSVLLNSTHTQVYNENLSVFVEAVQHTYQQAFYHYIIWNYVMVMSLQSTWELKNSFPFLNSTVCIYICVVCVLCECECVCTRG